MLRVSTNGASSDAELGVTDFNLHLIDNLSGGLLARTGNYDARCRNDTTLANATRLDAIVGLLSARSFLRILA